MRNLIERVYPFLVHWPSLFFLMLYSSLLSFVLTCDETRKPWCVLFYLSPGYQVYRNLATPLHKLDVGRITFFSLAFMAKICPTSYCENFTRCFGWFTPMFLPIPLFYFLFSASPNRTVFYSLASCFCFCCFCGWIAVSCHWHASGKKKINKWDTIWHFGIFLAPLLRVQKFQCA